MADLKRKTGSFGTPVVVGAGLQAITGIGFEPKALIVWVRGESGYRVSLGIATGPAEAFAVSATSLVDPANANARRAISGRIIRYCETAPSIEANLHSLDADGFTLEWLATTGGSTVHYLALGGGDLTNAKAIKWDSPATTGNKAVTGVGFNPDCVLNLSAGDFPGGSTLPQAEWDVQMCLGVMEKNGGQWVNTIFEEGQASQSSGNKGTLEDQCIAIAHTQTTWVAKASRVSNDPDGFTVNFGSNSIGVFPIISLCLKGPRFKAGHWGKSTGAAPASDPIIGTGFQVRALLLASSGMTQNANGTENVRLTAGFADGAASERSHSISNRSGETAPSPNASTSSTRVLSVLSEDEPTAVELATADIQSLDPDGFTIQWSPNNATAYRIHYLAIGDTNDPPFAPALIDKKNFDAATAQVFEWAFSDPNSGDTQAAYQLRIIRVSDSAVIYDSGKTVSGSVTHNVPASTLVNGVDYQWEVRVWDQLDVPGPYSTRDAFSTSQTPTAVVTSPTEAQVVATAHPLVTWTFSGPEGGETQSAYRMVLEAGAATVLDTGKVTSAVLERQLNDLLNNTAYVLELEVWDSKDVKSAVVVRNFTTAFLVPPAPTIVLTPH